MARHDPTYQTFDFCVYLRCTAGIEGSSDSVLFYIDTFDILVLGINNILEFDGLYLK